MAHHRVAQVQRFRIGRLDACHAREDRPALRRTAQIPRQHRIAVAQLADGGNPVDQRRNLLRSQHFAGPLLVLRVVGELDRVERPDVDPDTLHREHRCAVAGVAEYHMGLDSEQMRRTFHGGGILNTMQMQ